MHISLTEQQEQWIQSLIKGGHYSSTSEVLRHAVRLLQQEAEAREAGLLALREAVRKGVAQIERGDFSMKSVSDIVKESKRVHST